MYDLNESTFICIKIPKVKIINISVYYSVFSFRFPLYCFDFCLHPYILIIIKWQLAHYYEMSIRKSIKINTGLAFQVCILP